MPARIVATALALRASHPQAPALDVLDLALQGRGGQALDFGSDGLPPAPFALLVAEAFDHGMDPALWAAWTAPGANPAVSTALRGVWANEVWPRFAARYGIGG